MWGKDKMLVCPRCNNPFSPNGHVKYISDWDKKHCYSCFFIIEFKRKLRSLLDSKVMDIQEIEEDNTFVLLFDNGLRLTARDGEYGNNAFDFIEEETDVS